MENDVSPAPRAHLFSLVAPWLEAVPKGTVLLLLAVGSWWFAVMSIMGLWRGAALLAHHWPL